MKTKNRLLNIISLKKKIKLLIIFFFKSVSAQKELSESDNCIIKLN